MAQSVVAVSQIVFAAQVAPQGEGDSVALFPVGEAAGEFLQVFENMGKTLEEGAIPVEQAEVDAPARTDPNAQASDAADPDVVSDSTPLEDMMPPADGAPPDSFETGLIGDTRGDDRQVMSADTTDHGATRMVEPSWSAPHRPTGDFGLVETQDASRPSNAVVDGHNPIGQTGQPSMSQSLVPADGSKTTAQSGGAMTVPVKPPNNQGGAVESGGLNRGSMPDKADVASHIPASGMHGVAQALFETVHTRVDPNGKATDMRTVVRADGRFAVTSDRAAAPTVAGPKGASLAAPETTTARLVAGGVPMLPGEPAIDLLPMTTTTNVANPGTGAPTATMVAVQSSPDAARLVAQQISVAVSQSGSGTTELQLSPQELGRVRIVLSPQDAGLVVSVYTERPEVNDLMRRHIDQLAQEFGQIGYDDVSFDFQQDTPQRQMSDGDPDGAPFASDTDQTDTQVITQIVADSGLDLRL